MNLRVERSKSQQVKPRSDAQKSDAQKKLDEQRKLEAQRKLDEQKKLDEQRRIEAAKKTGLITATPFSALSSGSFTFGRTNDTNVLRNELESKVPQKTNPATVNAPVTVAKVDPKDEVTPERKEQLDRFLQNKGPSYKEAERIHTALQDKSELGPLTDAEKRLLVDKAADQWAKDPVDAASIEGLSFRAQKDPALAPIVGEQFQKRAIELSRTGPNAGASTLAAQGIAALSSDKNAQRASLEKLGPEGAQRLFDALNLKEKSFEPVLGTPPGANTEMRMASAVELLKTVNQTGEPTPTSAALVDRMFTQIGPSAFKTEWNGKQLGEELGTALGNHWKTDPAERSAEAARLKGILGSEAGRELVGHQNLTPQARLERLQLLAQHPEWDAASFQNAGSLGDMPQVLEALAKPRFEQYANLRGDEPRALKGTDLENTVGMSMGFRPKEIPADETPAQRELREKAMAEGKHDAFAGTEDAPHIQKVTDSIRSLGGEPPQVTVLPIQYNSKQTGPVELPLFRVKGKDGSDQFVDNTGRTYKSFEDWKTANVLDPGQVTYPKDGHLGKPPVMETKATPRTVDTPGEYVKEALNYGALVGGTVAGVAIVIGSGGTAAPIVATAAAAYGAYTSGERLYDRYTHGQTINPLQDRQAASEWVGFAANTLGVASFGATSIASRMMSSGAKYGPQAATAASFFRVGANVADMAAAGDAGVTLATNWDKLSGSERAQLALSMGFWGAGTAAGMKGPKGEIISPFDAKAMRDQMVYGDLDPSVRKALDGEVKTKGTDESVMATIAQSAHFKSLPQDQQLAFLSKYGALSPEAKNAFTQGMTRTRSSPAAEKALSDFATSRDVSRLAPAKQAEAIEAYSRLGDEGRTAFDAEWSRSPRDREALVQLARAPRFADLPPQLQKGVIESPSETRPVLIEELGRDHGDPSRNRAAAETLGQLSQSKGFQFLPFRDRERLLRYVGGTNAELSAPARQALGQQLADPAFQNGTPKEQFERLQKFMTEQPGLTSNVDATPGSWQPNTTVKLSEGTPVPEAVFNGVGKPATRYLMEVDGRQIPVFVATDPSAPGTYTHSVEEVRQALERIPKVSRDQINIIKLDNTASPSDAHWQKVFGNPNHRAYMDAGANGELNLYPAPGKTSLDYMTGSIVHETGHFYSSPKWGTDSVNDPGWQKWRNAIYSDGFAPSVYGKNNPSEDFSESMNLYAAVKGTPREAELRAIMPQRFKMLDAIWEQQK